MKKAYRAVALTVIAIIIFTSAAYASAINPPKNEKPAKQDLERVDFIHKAKGSKTQGSKADAGYKLMGVRWGSLPVTYAINPNNSQGLSERFIINTLSLSAETWDSATSQELFNDGYVIDESAEYGVFDNKNAIAFGTYPDNSVIAVTSVWYVRQTKQIVDFDMLFNQYYTWGDAGNDPDVMDLQNIATHEFGHSVGLSDIYSTSFSYVTMFGYSNYGDIEKRSLEQPDINGLKKIYGP